MSQTRNGREAEFDIKPLNTKLDYYIECLRNQIDRLKNECPLNSRFTISHLDTAKAIQAFCSNIKTLEKMKYNEEITMTELNDLLMITRSDQASELANYANVAQAKELNL